MESDGSVWKWVSSLCSLGSERLLEIEPLERRLFARRLTLKSYEILLGKRRLPAPDIGEWEGEEVLGNALWAVWKRTMCLGRHWNKAKHEKVTSLLKRLEKALDRNGDENHRQAVMDMLKVLTALGIASTRSQTSYHWDDEEVSFFPKILTDYRQQIGRMYRTYTVDSFELHSHRHRQQPGFRHNASRKSDRDSVARLLTHWKLPETPSLDQQLFPVQARSIFAPSSDRLKKSVSWDTWLGSGALRNEPTTAYSNSHNLIDEGFVTPNEDHKEVTPIFEDRSFFERRRKAGGAEESGHWDWKIVGVKRAERHLTWEWIGRSGPAPTETCVWFESRAAVSRVYAVQRASAMLDSARASPRQAIAPHLPPLQTLVRHNDLVSDIKSALLDVASQTFIRADDGRLEFCSGCYTEDILPDVLRQLCRSLPSHGRLFGRLLDYTSEPSKDIISEALKRELRSYLHRYECLILRIPETLTLLHILSYIRPLLDQLYMIRSVLFDTKMKWDDTGDCGLDEGKPPVSDVQLLDRMYSALRFVASPHCQYLLTSFFVHTCQVYYSLLDKWVFEGTIERSSVANETLDRSSWVNGRFTTLDQSSQPIVKETVERQLPHFLKPLASNIAHSRKTITLLTLCHPQDKLLKLLSSLSATKEVARPRIRLRLGESQLQMLEAECLAFQTLVLRQCVPCPHTQPSTDIQEVIRHRARALEKFNKDRENIRRAMLRKKEKDLDEQRRDLAAAQQRQQAAKRRQLEEDERINREAHVQELIRINADKIAKMEQIEKLQRLNLASDKARAKTQWKLKRLVLADKRKEAVASLARIEENLTTEDEELEEAEEKMEVEIDGGESKAKEEDIDATTKDVGVETEEMKKSDVEKDDIGEVKEERSEELTDAQKIRAKVKRLEYGENQVDSGFGSCRQYRPVIKLSKEAQQNKRRVMDSEFHFGWSPPPAYQQIIHSAESPMDVEVEKEEPEKVTREEEEEETIRTEKTDKKYEVKNTELEKLSENISENSEELKCAQDGEMKEDLGEQDDLRSGSLSSSTTGAVDQDVLDLAQEQEEEQEVEVEDNKEIFVDCVEMEQSVLRSVFLPLGVQLSLVNAAAIRMMIEHYNLIGHLENFRRYYLLLDVNMKRTLRNELLPAVEGSTPGALLLPGRVESLVLGPGPHPKELSLALSQQLPPAFNLASSQCLHPIVLRYRVEWPMNIVVSPMTLAKYEEVFAFLLNVERASWCLHQVIYILNIKSAHLRGHHYTQLQLYRHVMSHYVLSLQAYLNGTVLEASWEEFNKRAQVPEAKHLDDLYEAHVAYIKNILYRCFLNKRATKLRLQLVKLTEAVFAFYLTLKSGEFSVDDDVYKHSRFSRLRHCFRSFLQLANYVTRYVERLVQFGYQSPHLDVLHRLLTLNRFYLDLENKI